MLHPPLHHRARATVAALLALAFSLPPCGSIRAQTLDTLPGGIVRLDDYRAPDGYYAFWPVLPEGDVYSRDSLGLVIFSHGYSVINPINYGAWLRHLVTEQRQVVIYPRYQRSVFLPSSKAFAKTHHAGLSAAMAYLDTASLALSHAPPIYIGHSYGAVLTAYAIAHQDSLGYAPAFGAVLAAPGTNRLKGSRLQSYGGIDPETQLVIVTHEADRIVGDEFARLLYETVPDSTHALWLHQRAEEYGGERLGQGHSECYALDEDFDAGTHRLSVAHARRTACEDALDHELYWALADEMIAARREGRLHAGLRTVGDDAYPFGTWADGTPRQPLRARLRRRAPGLPAVERYDPDLLLDLLSEPNEYVPSPRALANMGTFEDMLQRLSVPADEDPHARAAPEQTADQPSPSPPSVQARGTEGARELRSAPTVVPAEAESPKPPR